MTASGISIQQQPRFQGLVRRNGEARGDELVHSLVSYVLDPRFLSFPSLAALKVSE